MRILVVEDEPRILSFLVRGLESEGFAVDSELDGASALRRAAARRYDLVVLDLLLPRLDGLSVLRELQRSRPGLPVVILSARSDLATKLRGFELGASDYVAKPFAADHLAGMDDELVQELELSIREIGHERPHLRLSAR